MLSLIANALLIATGGYRPQADNTQRHHRAEKAFKS